MEIGQFPVEGGSPLIGKTIREADISDSIIIGIERSTIPSAFFFLFPTDYPVNYQSAKSKVMNNKKKNEGQTDFSMRCRQTTSLLTMKAVATS